MCRLLEQYHQSGTNAKIHRPWGVVRSAQLSDDRTWRLLGKDLNNWSFEGLGKWNNLKPTGASQDSQGLSNGWRVRARLQGLSAAQNTGELINSYYLREVKVYCKLSLEKLQVSSTSELPARLPPLDCASIMVVVKGKWIF